MPNRRVLSEDLERELHLPAGWIYSRTGIKQRAIAEQRHACSDLAIKAAKDLLERLKPGIQDVGFQDVGLLLLATSTPDHLLPPTAPVVAHALGLSCGAIDVAGACTGFLYALSLAASHSKAHGEQVLVIASNVLSRRIDSKDQATRPLFADGAGALLLAADSPRLLGQHLASAGEHSQQIHIPAGGSRRALSTESILAGDHFLQMQTGPELFRLAVCAMVESSQKALVKAGLMIQEIDLWIPHQANQRIIEAVARRLGIDMDRCIQTIKYFGNSSAATIPIAMQTAVDAGRLCAGQKILLTAAGAGLLEAAVVIEW